MNAKEIAKKIDRDFFDIEFEYNGKYCSVCPVERTGIKYGDEIWDYKTTLEAVQAKVFDGKSLVDIWDEVERQVDGGAILFKNGVATEEGIAYAKEILAEKGIEFDEKTMDAVEIIYEKAREMARKCREESHGKK